MVPAPLAPDHTNNLKPVIWAPLPHAQGLPSYAEEGPAANPNDQLTGCSPPTSKGIVSTALSSTRSGACCDDDDEGTTAADSGGSASISAACAADMQTSLGKAGGAGLHTDAGQLAEGGVPHSVSMPAIASNAGEGPIISSSALDGVRGTALNGVADPAALAGAHEHVNEDKGTQGVFR